MGAHRCQPATQPVIIGRSVAIVHGSCLIFFPYMQLDVRTIFTVHLCVHGFSYTYIYIYIRIFQMYVTVFWKSILMIFSMSGPPSRAFVTSPHCFHRWKSLSWIILRQDLVRPMLVSVLLRPDQMLEMSLWLISAFSWLASPGLLYIYIYN